MSEQELWILDPETGKEVPIKYSELEDEFIESFIRPIGGFIFPANLFCLSRLPSVPFYVKDWLPKRGKSMLYAPAKSGKSYLCQQLARCVASGEPFLGIPTTEGRTMYVQFELGEEILQARLRQTGKDYENVYVGTSFSMKLDTESGQKQLARALEAVEPQVLILDPKYKMIIGEENEASDMRKVCDFLDTMIELFNCSVLIIDHAGFDISKRNRGSTIWEDWVDSLIQMQKVSKNGEQMKVRLKPVFLRHASLPPEPIDAVLGDDFEFHTVGAVPTVKEQVLRYIRAEGHGVSPAQLFDEKIGSNTSVYKALKELAEEKKIRKTQWGVYNAV